MRTRKGIAATALAATLCVGMIAGLALGSSFMPVDRVLAALASEGSRADTIIIWNLRMPRMLMAVLAGAALAVAGTLLQRTTRNPLAAPSVLGIVDGAALGVLLFLWWFSNEANALTVPILWQPLAAIAGAGALSGTVAVLWWREMHDPMRLILYGVALAALANAVVVLMIIAGPIFRASQALIWLAGSVHLAKWWDVQLMALALAVLVVPLIAVTRPFDQMRLDDQSAQSTGLPVAAYRAIGLLLSVLLTAIAVSLVGGIGFVGLIAPHLARLLFGTAIHQQLLGAATIGAIMILGADLLVRLAFAPLEVPAGALTALIGAPYFLFILVKKGAVHA
ncbi:MAG: iron ABC transporter permease [Pseudomonadota bacterium]